MALGAGASHMGRAGPATRIVSPGVKIALVGASRRTRDLAPFNDPAWQIWVTSNKNARALPRHDAWFELHTPEAFARDGEEYDAWLKAQPLVYMQEAYPQFPGAVAFERDSLVREFGPYFFTSSIAWMFARAISLHPDAIGIWGVEQAVGGEFVDQRPATLHFALLARERGIRIVTPPDVAFLEPPKLYGYEY